MSVWAKCFAFIAVTMVAPPALGQRGSATGGRKATVDLVSSVEAIAPGQSFDLGIRFHIKDDWHIYWQNGGDAGIPPKATWKLPAGFNAGPLQFPVPKSHIDQAGLIGNLLDGEPIFLVTIQAPSSLSGSNVAMAAHVDYLVCEATCIRESADVRLVVPATQAGSKPQAANVDVFKRAYRSQPKKESKYVKITPSVTTETFAEGTKFDLVVDVNVARGHHVQSNAPFNKAFIKSEVFVRRVANDTIFFERPLYPPPRIRQDKAFGKISEYAGRISIRVPGEVYETPAPGPVEFGGIFKYQACTDSGKCFPPEAVSFSFTVGKGIKVGAAAPLGTPPAANHSAKPATETSEFVPSAESDLPTTFLGWMAFSFLGGLILNIMPCVLPVISIKILSFVQQSKESRGRVVGLGLTFSSGVIISFWVLALVIILLKEAGNELGWGFQFQSPRFVIIMMSIVFVFGLSLFGVFQITLPGAATTKLSAAEDHEGYGGAFMKGVLGTVLATPCTAPFLGPALGVAFRSTHIELFAFFTAIGFGMASPFIVLSLFPSWLRFLPRPGMWMEHFKQFMGFLLMGTVVFLMFTLGDQIGARGLVWTSFFLVFLALGCWLIGRVTPMTPVSRRLLAWSAAIALACVGWWNSFEQTAEARTIDAYVQDVRDVCNGVGEDGPPHLVASDWEHKVPWQRWSKGRPERLAAQGYTVYVDYTATWCATCLANKKATIEREPVRNQMRDNCVIPIKADFTMENPAILQDLNKFGRSGVPLNIIYPAGRPDEPIIMPEQLVGRTDLVLEKLKDAGASLACRVAASMVEP